MEEKELWKTIKNYPNYEISNLGKIKSKSRLVKRKNNRNYIIQEKILKQYLTKGYYRVSLFANGKIVHKLVHRLMAEVFIPNPNNLPEINHKNEIKTDNRVENLEWCSSKYNCNYGTRNKRINEKNKKTINQYDLNGNYIKTWESAKEASLSLNKINGAAINGCCKGKYKQMYGYIWRYVNE